MIGNLKQAKAKVCTPQSTVLKERKEERKYCLEA